MGVIREQCGTVLQRGRVNCMEIYVFTKSKQHESFDMHFEMIGF
jgi:hypothetical protein